VARPIPLLPPAPRRTARRIGIACGAIVAALIVIGQVMVLGRAATNGAFSQSAVVPLHGSVAHRLTAILSTALGPSDRAVRRFRIVRLQSDRSRPRLKDVAITWALNSNLSAGTVGNGGEEDVYAMLRGIYGSNLPVARVQFTGTYRSATANEHEQTVMRLSMGRRTAQIINGGGWDTFDAETIWPLVTRTYVAPAFQPLSSDG
jgi:hypothetical protein